jgi:putative transposase
VPESTPSAIGRITLDAKPAGERRTGNPCAPFDRAGAGDGLDEVPRQPSTLLRNLERKTPKHALAEVRDDFHRIVYAASGEAARAAVTAFERKWAKRCPGMVRSLQEGGAELLTFFDFPRAQWKVLRTTNVIERLNGEFRRRVKTQSALPSEDTAVVLLFSLVASGQIRLRRIDGWRKIAAVIRQRARVAA